MINGGNALTFFAVAAAAAHADADATREQLCCCHCQQCSAFFTPHRSLLQSLRFGEKEKRRTKNCFYISSLSMMLVFIVIVNYPSHKITRFFVTLLCDATGS